MPITLENCESFYQGAFAEHHISSLFFFYGYEAQKLSPDVGIDLVVTNLARARFRGEDPLHVEIQVKSVLLDSRGAYLKIAKDELDYLCTGEHRYCVFVILHDLAVDIDPESFERGDDPDAMNAIERETLRLMEIDAAKGGRAMRRQGTLSIHDFNQVDLTPFWLHSSQIKRMRDTGMWKLWPDGTFGLKVDLVDSSVLVAGTPLIPELHDVRFIVRPSRADDRIRKGDMSFDDY